MRLSSLSSCWKAYLIIFQIDLVPPQYHIDKVFKSSRHSAVVSAESCIVVMGLLFILGILAQVRARPKEVGDTPSCPLDVLHLGHHLRSPSKASKSSWRHNPRRARVYFGLQEQPALKQTPRSHTESDLGALGMDGNKISIRFQWNWSQAQIHLE